MIFDALANILTNDNSAYEARTENRRNRQFQDVQNEKARNFEYQMWLLNNQYNTPSAQMLRYRDAGLNPFLADQTKLGSGNSQNVPTAPMSASGSSAMPNRIPISGFDSPFEYVLQKQQVDANVGNQQAQMLKTFTEAANEAFRNGNKWLGDKIIDIGFSQYGKTSSDISLVQQQSYENVILTRSQSRLNNASAYIEENYSPREAEERITKLQDECMQIHAQIGLWSSMAKLNDKYGDRADAEIEKLIADAYKSWIESSYVKSLKATEDQKRQWYVANLLFEAANNGFLFSNNLADFEETKGVREYKSSPEGQNRAWYKYTLDNTYVGITYDKLTKMANQATGSFTPYKSSVHYDNFSPWQTNYRKRERTYSGSDGSSVRLTDYLEK